jgi:hypothetical protein
VYRLSYKADKHLNGFDTKRRKFITTFPLYISSVQKNVMSPQLLDDTVHTMNIKEGICG